MSPVVSPEEVDSRLRALPGDITLRSEDAKALAKLDVSFSTIRRAARPTEHSPRRIRTLTLGAAIAAALIVILQANLVAIYFAPSYSRALADSPGVGPISSRVLHALGLSSSDLTVIGDSATSAGHTLKLEGAYADGLRTVLLVSIDGKGLAGDPKQYGRNDGEWGLGYAGQTLTDQFGHTYEHSGIGGPTELQFKPLAWPASEVGARLTLHVTSLDAIWTRTTGHAVTGDWYLRVTMTSQGVQTLPLPAPVRTADAVYTYTSVVASARTLIIHWTITGPVTSRLVPPFTPDETQPLFSPRVFDLNGNEMQLQDYGSTWPRERGGPISAETTVFIHGPGQYRIQVATSLNAPDQQRWIRVL